MSVFADKALQILIDQIPEPSRAAFSVHADGYFCGLLGPDTASSAFMRGSLPELELYTTDRAAFSMLIQALPESALMAFAKPVVDTSGWSWCDRAFEGLPGTVRTADPLLSLCLTEADGDMKPETWQDIEGAQSLAVFPVGEDPRVTVSGHEWVRYMAAQLRHAGFAMGSSCEFRPTGVYFEAHEAALADFIEQAYGAHFNLPACEIARSESGPRKERLHHLEIKVPGARPMMGLSIPKRNFWNHAMMN